MYATPFIDETFDINNCQNYILSIQCALDGFSFSILDLTIKKFIVLGNYELNAASPFELKKHIETIINSEQILQNIFKQVKICFVSNKIMIVPESLIDRKATDLFDFSFELLRDEEIIRNQLLSDKVILSAIPQAIKELFETVFINCQFFTSAEPIINYSKYFSALALRFFIIKYNHTLQVLVLKEGNIEFLNSFFVKNDADCIYYLLNTAKNLNANAKTEIVLVGKIENKTFLIKTLENYFERVYSARFSSKYAVSYTFMSEPENNHLPLIELALCE